MSDEIQYRRLVVSIARQLSPEERQAVAYIRLKKEDITKYSLQNKDVTGIDLLARLECLGVFSQKNIDGLKNIAKDINRPDLKGEVKDYKKNAKTSTSKQSKKTPQKISTPSAERQELEGTYELLVKKLSSLEKNLSELQETLSLSEEGSIQNKGAEIVRNINESVQNLASDLRTTCEKLPRRPRASSIFSTGSSESSLDSRRSSSGSFFENQISSDPNFPIGHVQCHQGIQPFTASTSIQTQGNQGPRQPTHLHRGSLRIHPETVAATNSLQTQGSVRRQSTHPHRASLHTDHLASTLTERPQHDSQRTQPKPDTAAASAIIQTEWKPTPKPRKSLRMPTTSLRSTTPTQCNEDKNARWKPCKAINISLSLRMSVVVTTA